MLSIFSASQHAPFNIATEEYLLRHTEHEVFLLYVNRPSIIVGVHQNSIAEINYDYVREQNIPVVRRLTGGGTVFHDLGNLNFCFIMKSAEDSPWNFQRYTAPILELLQELGVNAILKGRNDLVIDDLKFSGNAKLVEKGKILQHGTILFSSRMGDLTAALKVNPLKFSDKAVKSIRSRVTNVSEHLPHPLSLQDFTAKLRTKVHSIYPEVQDYAFDESEVQSIQKLADEKYSTWDWNFGSSPKYNLSRAIRTAAGTIEAYLDIQNGRIETIRIFGDFFSSRPICELEASLQGTPHEEKALLAKLAELELGEYFGAVNKEDIMQVLI